jgi:Na+/melibiose symporter-like transporter
LPGRNQVAHRAVSACEMKLVSVLCAFIGVVLLFFVHSLFGIPWLVAGLVFFAIDHFYGD